MYVSRRFALIIQDPATCTRAQASAARDMVEVLAATDTLQDCDRDDVAIAADWALQLLNTNAFFTMHPILILQVLSTCYHFSSPSSSHSNPSPLKAARLCFLLPPLLPSSTALSLHRAICRCCRHPCKYVRFLMFELVIFRCPIRPGLRPFACCRN